MTISMTISEANGSTDLNRDKLEFDKLNSDREYELKKRAQDTIDKEFDFRKATYASLGWSNPLIVAVIAAAVAAIGNAGVSYYNAGAQRILEGEKSEQARILEMLKARSPDKAAENLKFLLETGLVADRKTRQRLTEFLEKRQKGTGPVLSTSGLFPEIAKPIVDNPRVVLLAGSTRKSTLFRSLGDELDNAGFRISRADILYDGAGSDGTEIRYFNDADRKQAEEIAAVLSTRYSNANFPVRKIGESAAPGYFEIWLGR